MLIIYPEKLNFYLLKKIYSCYLLLGNEIILLQESINQIIKINKKYKLLEKHSFLLKKNSDWKKIFLTCQEQTLFSNKKILFITITSNLILSYKNKFLYKLNNLLIKNITLIINCDESISQNQQLKFFNTLKIEGIIINCTILNKRRLSEWINFKLYLKKITINEDSKKILIQYYYGNLIELTNILNIIFLLYPNQYVDCHQLKNIIYDSSNFSIFQWIDAILKGNKEKSLRILKQLFLNNFNPLYLIRMLQNNLIVLFSMKRHNNTNNINFLHSNKIWEKRHSVFIYACTTNNEEKIYKIIKLITYIELSIKRNIQIDVWNKLKNLSLILSN